MDRITGSGCEVCRGAVPSGKESSGHTGLCAQVLADALAAERARAERAEAEVERLRDQARLREIDCASLEATTNDALSRLSTIIDEEYGMQPVLGTFEEALTTLERLANERRQRQSARLAKLEAVAAAARTAHARIAHGVERQSAALVCGDLRASDDAIEEIDSARMVLCDALAALDGGGK